MLISGRMLDFFSVWRMNLNDIHGLRLLVYGVTFGDCSTAIFLSAAAMQGECCLSAFFIDSYAS